MNNQEKLEQWAHRYRDRIEKEAEEERKKKEQEELEKEKNKGKKLKKEKTPDKIDSPDFSSAFFLGDEFGKQIHEKVQAKYSNLEAINKVVYDEKDKIVKGSTPFYVVAVNEILQEEFPQFRTAIQADLEKILKDNKLPLRGQYEDSSLVLRTKENPNKYLAEDLFNQFKDKGIVLKEDSAYVLPLFTLKLRKDGKSNYKLSFDLTDSTLENYFEAPILNEVSQKKFNSIDIEEKTGLPKKLQDKGERTLYTRNYQSYDIKNSGLVGLYLYGNLNIDSDDGDLAGCGAGGRVVVVSAEGTAKI